MATRYVIITRVAPGSAFKTALSLSLIGLISWLICVVILYFGMQAVGIWDKINQVIGGVGGDQIVSFGLIISLAALLGTIVAIIATVLAPLTALAYNAFVDLFGGVEVTMREELD